MLKEKQSLIGDLQLRAGGNRHNKTSSSEVWGPGPSVHRYYEKMSPRVQKWAVPKYMYKWSSFPVFLSGSGYVIGGKEAANCLLTESHVSCTLFTVGSAYTSHSEPPPNRHHLIQPR